jgi:nucleotide-binding universal stress UspA family protein
MFKKILLPLDGSGAAEQALFWATQYARPSKAQVVLLQVLHKEYPLEGLPFRTGGEEARRYLQGIERVLNYAGIPTKIILRSEPVSRAIVETAKREGCDLIIMTSRGASKVIRWLMGGVAQQVMRLSSVPVLIVRSQIALDGHKRPKRVVVPQDGSPPARAILPWAKKLARFHRIPLLILHVRPERRNLLGKERFLGVARELSRESAQLRSQGIKTAIRLEQGDPAEEILKACRPTDLLAMTTHGYGGVKRLLLGSVAEKVIHQASVPILIYKRQAKTRRLPGDLATLEILEP